MNNFRTINACRCLLFCLMAAPLHSQQGATPASAGNRDDATAAKNFAADTPSSVLSSDEWQRVDASVARGLAFLASQQQPDGSFPTLPYAQPAVTGLGVLALMAHGHNPSEGPYGRRLDRASEFILASQKSNGLVTVYGPEGRRITRDGSSTLGAAAAYCRSAHPTSCCPLFQRS